MTDLVSDRFVRAVTSRDFAGIAACLTAETQFRALVPRGLRQASAPEEAARYFQTWFGSADRVEVLTTCNESVGDRQHLMWRLFVDESGETKIVEQHAFAIVDQDRIIQLDLLCSGFRQIQAEGPCRSAVVACLVSGAPTLSP